MAKTVKTAAGARKYGKPIGTVLTGRTALQKHGVMRGNRNIQNLAGRSDSAFHPGPSAAEHRKVKDAIRAAVEVPRRVRPPANWSERESLTWQSPAKRAESRALTGDVVMPRRDAVRREASVARMARFKSPRVAVQKTFTGKRRVVRGIVPKGAQPIGVGHLRVGK